MKLAFPCTLSIAVVVVLGITGAPARAGDGDDPKVHTYPAVIAAMEHVKDQCTKDTPCKYKVQPFGERTFVTIEFTRKETPTSEPKPYPGGRAKLTIDKQGKLLDRVDGE